MKLPIYIISDSHFRLSHDQAEKERRQRMYNFLEYVRTTGGTLLIGGDFFDFWFNYKYVVPEHYIDILQELERLFKSGIKIHYVVGNHDYWDFGYFSEKFGAVVHYKDFEFIIDGQKILFTHGDGLLKNDYKYRLMKKFIRSKLCIFLFRNFHPDWGCALAKFVSRSSGEYHHHDDLRDMILSEIGAFAKRKWEQEYDAILVGHYHQTGIYSDEKKHLIYLGDWLNKFTITKFDGKNWSQQSWDPNLNKSEPK